MLTGIEGNSRTSWLVRRLWPHICAKPQAANHPSTQRAVETCADREQPPLPCCRISTEPVPFGLPVAAIHTVPATAAWRRKRKNSTRERRSDNSASPSLFRHRSCFCPEINWVGEPEISSQETLRWLIHGRSPS